MGCCFCCMNDEQKVDMVLRKFPAKPAREAVDNMLQKVVGRVVSCGEIQGVAGNVLWAPASGKPCVFYSIKIEEEYKVTEHDDETGTSTTRSEWETILEDSQSRDFYLQDGAVKILVNGANSEKCKISSEAQVDDSDAGWFRSKEPPLGVRQLVGVRNPGFSWYTDNDHDGDVEVRRRTGDLRWTERSFDLNETLACLGVPAQGVDAYTGQPVKIMQPINEECLTEEYFEQNEWSSFEKKSWHTLTKEAACLISDKEEFVEGIDVLPAMLPAAMMQPLNPQMIGTVPLYQPIANPVVIQPIPIQTYVMPGQGQVVPVVQVAHPGQVIPSTSNY